MNQNFIYDVEQSFSDIQKKALSSDSDVELLVSRTESLSVGFQKGRREKFDSSTSQCAGFRVIKDGYPGYAYTENLSPEALNEAFQNALENAKFTALADDSSLKMSLHEDHGHVEELKELFSETFDRLPIEAKLERARLLEEKARSADPRVISVPYSGYREAVGETIILNSKGMRRQQRYSSMSGHSYCLAKEGEESRMAGEFDISTSNEIFDADSIAKKAASLAVAKLGSRSPKTGHYPVLIENKVACSFLSLLIPYFSAKSVFDKESLFGEELNKKIASDLLTIIDDPFYSGGMGTRAFDSEGAKSRKTPVIENGRLSAFLTNSVYAKRMKLPHTANGSRGPTSELGISSSNFAVKPGASTFRDLIGSAPQVILINDLTGYHAGFKKGSGDFSLQAEGELWENGSRVAPLSNFVVSGNIRDLLMSITGLSDRLEKPHTGVIAPDLLIRELSIAGSN